jgi:hypothetical protein
LTVEVRDPTINELKLFMQIRHAVFVYRVHILERKKGHSHKELLRRLDTILTPVPILPEDHPECMICLEELGKSTEDEEAE